MLLIQCPACGLKLSVPPSLAGGVGVCPECRQMFRIPALRVAPQPPAPYEPQSPGTEAERPGRLPYAFAQDREPPPAPRRLLRHPLEDEEEDDFEPDPVRRRRRKRRGRTAGPEPGGSLYFLGLMLTLAVLWIVVGVLGLLAPAVAILATITGAMIGLAAGIWFLANAFEDDGAGVGLLCLVLPFYALFYLGTHWDRERQPFFLGLAGSAFSLLGIVLRVVHRGGP